VSPEEVLFFDDTSANVRAAQAAGWHAVEVVRTAPVASQLVAALGPLLPGRHLGLFTVARDA